MNGLNMFIEHEQAKIKFKMIFNEDTDNYNFTNAKHIDMVAEYGKFTGDVKKSLELVDVPNKEMTISTPE